MTYRDEDDDDWDPAEEGWADDEQDETDESYDEEEDSAPCPECGQPVPGFLDKCPACGYWLTEEDRHAMRSHSRRPQWLIVTAWVVLAAFLIPIGALVVAVLRREP